MYGRERFTGLRNGAEHGPFTREQMAQALRAKWNEIAGDIFDALGHDKTMTRKHVLEVTNDTAYGEQRGALGQYAEIMRRDFPGDFNSGEVIDMKLAKTFKRERKVVEDLAFPKTTKRYCY
jgi:hypothetical protein